MTASVDQAELEAAQHDRYLESIAAAGFVLDELRVNDYEFLSDRARNASERYGVHSVSLLARTPGTPR